MKNRCKLQVNDSGHNEDIICLVNRSMGVKGMVFEAWTHKQVPLNLQWMALRINGTNFLQCWITDSIYIVRKC